MTDINAPIDADAEPTAPFAVRACTLDDAPALSVLGQATFLEAYTDVIDGAALITHCRGQHGIGAYESLLDHPRTSAWVAEAAGTWAPIGYALVAPPDMPGVTTYPDDLELQRIYVLWRYHGAGVGPALMRRAIDHAGETGARRLLLSVYHQNQRALTFYRRHGFQMAGTRRFQVGDRAYDDAVLALRV